MNWNFRVLRKLARLTFAQQLILLALVPATAATLTAIAVLTRQHLGNLTELMRANAQTVALQVATVAQAPLSRMDKRALQRTAQSGTYQPHVQQVQIWTEDGEIVANSETVDRARGEGLQVVVPIVADDGRHNGKVMVEISLSAVQNARRSVWLNVAVVLAISLVGVGLAGWWAARRISEPIRALGKAVDRLGAGEDASVAIEGTLEVQHLQLGFNQAARALAESRRLLQSRINEATSELARKNALLEVASQAKTRLLAAASHDLRQPLHALTLFSDGLANGETDPVKLQRIGHIRECVESLDRLFSELLNLSQLDAGVLQPQWADFPLDRLFDEISRNFRPVAEQQGLRLVARKTELWVRCDYVMLSRILNNLVSNSLRHTIEGGVLIGARRRGKGVRIDVVDTGVGIAAQHQTRVFEEFYQVEPTGRQSARGARGMGLGLATVQRLAELLNTRVELSSRLHKGTCVRVLVRSAPAALPAPVPSPVAAGIGGRGSEPGEPAHPGDRRRAHHSRRADRGAGQLGRGGDGRADPRRGARAGRQLGAAARRGGERPAAAGRRQRAGRDRRAGAPSARHRRRHGAPFGDRRDQARSPARSGERRHHRALQAGLAARAAPGDPGPARRRIAPHRRIAE
jgi:signal transduction histidine kinase